MVYQKIKLRNSRSTLTGLVITLLIIMGMFFGGYLYISEHTTNAEVSLDPIYSNIYKDLNESKVELQNTSDAIKTSVDKVIESPSIYQAAWNGLKGLGNTLKLPLQMTSITFGIWAALVTFTDFIPSWLIGLALIGIVTFVVFLVLRVLKGEPAV